MVYPAPPLELQYLIIAQLRRPHSHGMEGCPWIPPSTLIALAILLVPPAVVTTRVWLDCASLSHVIIWGGRPALFRVMSVTWAFMLSKASEQSRRVTHASLLLWFESSASRKISSSAIAVCPPSKDPHWSGWSMLNLGINCSSFFVILALRAL